MGPVNLLSTSSVDATVDDLKKARKIVQFVIGSNARGFVVTDAISDAIVILEGLLDHRNLKEAVEKLSRNEISGNELLAISNHIQTRYRI